MRPSTLMVFLASHGFRPLILAVLTAAPIQVSFHPRRVRAGGWTAIDYWLTEASLNPIGPGSRFRPAEEAFIFLAGSYYIHFPAHTGPSAPSRSASESLPVLWVRSNIRARSTTMSSATGGRFSAPADGAARLGLSSPFRARRFRRRWPSKPPCQCRRPHRLHSGRARRTYLSRALASDVCAVDTFPFLRPPPTVEHWDVRAGGDAGRDRFASDRVGADLLPAARSRVLHRGRPLLLVNRAVPRGSATENPARFTAPYPARLSETLEPRMDYEGQSRALEDAYRQVWRGLFLVRVMAIAPAASAARPPAAAGVEMGGVARRTVHSV